jgi:hypothetical protein
LPEASFKYGAVIGFKGTQAGAEQLTLRYYDDVKAAGDFVATENLSNQSFRSISLDGAAEFLRGGDPQASNPRFVREDEHRAVAAVEPATAGVNRLEFGVLPDALGRPEPRATFNAQLSTLNDELTKPEELAS